MAAIACSTRLSAAPRVATRKAVPAGVSRVARKMVVRASAQKESSRAVAIPAAVIVAAGAAMANPLVAEAAVTPSLRNFLYSLLAGATVLAGIAGAVTLVSGFDPVKRS